MVDARRAYRWWYLRRMSWLLPGLAAALFVVARLATERSLEGWIRLPALVISSGVALLFMGLVLVPTLALRAARRGDRRRSQSLRREFRSYPALALMSLSLALVLLSVPLLFGPSEHPALHSARTQAGPRAHRLGMLPTPMPAWEPEAVTFEPAPIQDATPPSWVPQESLPALVPTPEVPPLPPERIQTPIPPVPAKVDAPAGEELFTFSFRPDPDSLDDLRMSSGVRIALNRGGLPWGDDPADWPMPELQFDLTILPDSNQWFGAVYGTLVDVPVLKETSVRASYFIASLNDEDKEFDLEASVAWHRVTFEVEQRLAGYTRRATFDLALRAGLSVDRIDTHEASIAVDPAARFGPWVGIEVAFWQQNGLGLVMQAGHSFAVDVAGASSRVTDLRLELKIDLSEAVSFQIGWRYLALRIHDDAQHGAPANDHERSFSGPVAGLGIRF